MTIALLAILGVNLVVVAALLVALLGRRRWLRHQQGAFAGAAHLITGDLHGLGARRRRGYGRWVSDVLVWTPAPLFLNNAFAPVDRAESTETAKEKVRGFGDNPLTVTFASGENRIGVVVRAEDRQLALAPFTAAEGAGREHV